MSPVDWTKARPIGFWMRGLAGIVMVSFALSGYAIVQQSKATAEHAAERKSAATTQVGQCFSSVKNTPNVIKLLSFIKFLGDDLIAAKQNAILAQPDNPLNESRQASIDKLQDQSGVVGTFIAQTIAHAPTVASCNKLAKQLGVSPSNLNRP
jgi:hypothetical protein